LEKHSNLPDLLTTIDKLRGRDREEALQKALGVTVNDVNGSTGPTELSDDILALRELAEAIECAVRGNDSGALGLNWEDLHEQ
jgi:zinc finger HIT domain-containing protein 3